MEISKKTISKIMKTLSNEELEIIKKHSDMIKMIIRNMSYSNMTFEFKQDIMKICEAHNIKICTSCNSAMFTAINRVWAMYIEQMSQVNENKKSKKTKNK